MEEVTSNTTIAVMLVYLACHKEVYLGPKPKNVGNRAKRRLLRALASLGLSVCARCVHSA